MHYQTSHRFFGVTRKRTFLACTAVFAAAFALIYSPAAPLVWAGPPFLGFVDPNPTPGNYFGATVVPLSTGNVVITAPGDDAGGSDAGAVYLFNGATGALISTLTGSSANDGVGSGGVTALSNGNFVVTSFEWRNGAAQNAGAVTFGNGTTGVSGPVSAANSLVGSKPGDGVGFVVALSNGNYVVGTPNWDNGAVANAGAVTWGNGVAGTVGTISAANSLVGTTDGDFAGSVMALSNGNYLAGGGHWDNGAMVEAGIVAWGNGLTGTFGAYSAGNGLVGSSAGDGIGGGDGTGNTLVPLSNGNYVVKSPGWNGARGAVTWGNGAGGTIGAVSAANSLVGTTAGDGSGANGFSRVIALTNGNYVALNPNWDNGASVDVGAVTWGNGAIGTSGPITVANSLFGTTAGDLAFASVKELTNGNYVVSSESWDNAAVVSAGAATWGNGATGITGPVSVANSLVGTTTGDLVGSVVRLSNGNYVVVSGGWDNAGVGDVGAVTWGNGATGTSGPVSAANSLIGTTVNDRVGTRFGSPRVVALTNGSYVALSQGWDNGAAVNAGAVTWANGTTSTSGAVSAANSLVGAQSNDNVGEGGVTPLTNGNYVVGSPSWDGAASDVGAVTWGSGTAGVSGPVSAGNSLLGASAFDNVGADMFFPAAGITPLTNGNYVVWTSTWHNGAAPDAGAATWGNGATGTVGVVGAANSLVGTASGNRVGNLGVLALSNGNYVVNSEIVSAATWGNGATGTSGTVGPLNSIVAPGLAGAVADDVNGNFFARFPGSGLVRLGSQLDGIAPNVGPVSATNITPSTADISGNVTADNGSAVTARGFVYSQTSMNSTPTIGGTASIDIPVAGTTGAMAATLSSMLAATGYSVRGYATNGGGTAYGPVNTFTTGPLPTTTTLPATSVTQTGATLNGDVNPNGFSARRRFEYGLTASYGTTTSQIVIGAGNASIPVSLAISGLPCNTVHHFRTVGLNSGGLTNGGDLTFVTAACPAVGENNIAPLSARSIALNSTSRDFVSNARTEVWYRARLFAERSYQLSVWPIDHEQGVDAPTLALALFSNDLGTTAAAPAPVVSSAELEGSPNGNGDALPASMLFQPTTTGVYKLRILRTSGGVVPHTVNVGLRETSLFSPWTSRAAGFEGFIEMHNNTNAAVSVTLRAYDNAGVPQGAGLTFSIPANATVFKTATEAGVPVNAFAGVSLSHTGAFGAVSGNITTLNGANGLSFDSPFTPRDGSPQGQPVR